MHNIQKNAIFVYEWKEFREIQEKNLRNSEKHIAKFRNKVYYIIKGICRLSAVSAGDT